MKSAKTPRQVSTAQGGGNGWAVFALDALGHQQWGYEGETIDAQWHDALVKISTDGSRVAALAQNFYNGTIIYFDGSSGAISWEYPYYLRLSVADCASLAMSLDGSHVAGGCPASGILVLDASGKVLSGDGYTRGFGEPVLLLEKVSLIVAQNLVSDQVSLVSYNGTLMASPYLESAVTSLVGSPNGSGWVSAEGVISKSGDCSRLKSYDGTTHIWTTNLCR